MVLLHSEEFTRIDQCSKFRIGLSTNYYLVAYRSSLQLRCLVSETLVYGLTTIRK